MEKDLYHGWTVGMFEWWVGVSSCLDISDW